MQIIYRIQLGNFNLLEVKRLLEACLLLGKIQSSLALKRREKANEQMERKEGQILFG